MFTTPLSRISSSESSSTHHTNSNSNSNAITKSVLVVVPVIVKIAVFSIIIFPTVASSALQATEVSTFLQRRAIPSVVVSTDLQRRGAPPPPALAPYSCDPLPLKPETWKKLDIDNYLQHYPNGDKLNLIQFARENNASNFDCNLSVLCTAGQLCASIRGRAWWALAATEQLTYYQTEVYNAIGLAADKTRSIASGLVFDLIEQTHEKKANFFHMIAMILTLALAIVAIMAAIAFVWVPGEQVFAVVITTGAVVAIAGVTSTIRSHQEELKAAYQDRFTAWATLNDQIGKWEKGSTEAIANHFQQVINSPISSETGLYGALKGGLYCRNAQSGDENDLKLALSRVLTIRLVGLILRHKRAFVTYSSDRCNQNGPNGAFSLDDGWLSYCDKWDGTMMNVIYDNNGKSGNQLYGAKTLVQKYGITAEYITKQAHACWLLNKGPDYDPYQDGTNLPTDVNAPCLINLPVCDLTRKDVRKKRKKHGTVDACIRIAQIQLP